MTSAGEHWLCINGYYLRLPDRWVRILARVLDVLNRLLGGRLPCNTWIRYTADLERLRDSAKARGVVLTAMPQELIARLRADPRRDHPQLRTAVRLWEHDLRGGYVWLERGEPLCMQWLFTPADNARLRRLPEWSGMYPPLPPGCGQVENLLVMGNTLCRRGGTGTVFAFAMYELAASQGLKRLITHIRANNRTARAWAARTGLTAYGSIRRYHLNLPMLRGSHIYLHSSLPPTAEELKPRQRPIPARRRRATPAATEAAAIELAEGQGVQQGQ